MKIYEKAIENFKKKKKKFYKSELKRVVLLYRKQMESMMTTGECIGMECAYCPLFLLQNPNNYVACEKITYEERRKLIAMEFVEAAK